MDKLDIVKELVDTIDMEHISMIKFITKLAGVISEEQAKKLVEELKLK